MDFKSHVPVVLSYLWGNRLERGDTPQSHPVQSVAPAWQEQVCDRYLGWKGVRFPIRIREGLPAAGPISTATGLDGELTRAAKPSDEPLCRTHANTASSVSTGPAGTHRAPHFPQRPSSHPHRPNPCSTLSTAPQLQRAQLLGWDTPRSPAAGPGRSGEALMSFQCVFPGIL